MLLGDCAASRQGGCYSAILEVTLLMLNPGTDSIEGEAGRNGDYTILSVDRGLPWILKPFSLVSACLQHSYVYIG